MLKPFFITLSLAGIFSCKPKEGCLDRLARNFDVEAKKSATCLYDGRVVLYNGTDGTNAYANTLLGYYFNGQLMLVDGNLPQSAYEPLCDDPVGKTFVIDLGESTASVVRYQIKVQATKAVVAD